MAAQAPQSLRVESCSMLDTTPIFTLTLAWENPAADPYTSIKVERSTDNVSWETLSDSVDGEAETYVDSENVPYYDGGSHLTSSVYYRVFGLASGGYTAPSRVTIHHIYFDTVTETRSVSDLGTAAVAAEEFQEFVNLVDEYDETASSLGTTILENLSDTAVVTDSVRETNIEKLNIARYVLTDDGLVMMYGKDYYSDNGSVIPVYWESKDIDMDDQYPQFIGRTKYVKWVILRYMDHNSHDVTVGVSTDGGLTYTNYTRTIGAGTGLPREVMYPFRVYGRRFRVRVSHSSSNKDFQVLDMAVVFQPGGEHFEVS